jgi:hypothetical protein
MSRKTVKIEDLKNTVNGFLATSVCNDDVRQGMIEVLTTVLFSTDNYRGFRYLGPTEVPYGKLPGIHPDAIVDKFAFTDPTRVCYK